MKLYLFAALAVVASVVPASADAQTHKTKPRVHAARHRVLRHYAQAPYGRAQLRYYGGDGYAGDGGYDRGYPTDPYDVPAHGGYGRVPIGTYGEPVPFRTVQPTDIGIGVEAPNGYRGPGTASGGPAGGLDTGGGGR